MSNVSLFPQITAATNPHNVALDTVLLKIKSGHWQKVTESYRKIVEIHGKRSEPAKQAKKVVPYFTASGTFIKRSEEGLKDHSGFVAIDIDDIKPQHLARTKGRIAASKYAYAVFESVGGAGLCVIMRILPEEHADVFQEIRDYFARFLYIDIDYLADVSRARFVSYDPDLRLDKNAKVFALGCETQQDQSPKGQVKHYWTDEEQIAFAEKWTREKKGLDFVEGQRHRFVFEVACMANKLGVSQSVVESWAEQYAHWKSNPSNAITYPYKQYANDHGIWRKQKNIGDTESPPPLQADPTPKPSEKPLSQEITFSFKPVETYPVLMVNDVRTCSIGNVMTIVAYAGHGKSQTCEAICAGWINPECDSLGFSVDLPEGKNLLYIDGERTHEDCKKGFMRISRRADIANNPELLDDTKERMKRFFFESFIGIPDIAARKAELQRLIEERTPGLIIIDDITTIIEGTNDDKEAKEMRQWLVAQANTKGFGIVATIHPNPGDTENYKPRGHIGSEMWRVSESVYALKKAKDQPDIRRFTTDFPLSKTRSDTDINESNYSWNDDEMMFTTCDYSGATTSTTAKPNHLYIKMYDVFKQVGSYDVTPFSCPSGEFVAKYAELHNVSERTAIRHVNDAVNQGVISREGKSKTAKLTIIFSDEPAPF